MFRARTCMTILGMATALTAAPVAAQSQKKLPYWVAISKDEALMRVGPSMDYPANWKYRRRNLPVKVVELYPNWRRIEDSKGTRGWMHVRLLKEERTAIVTADMVEMHEDASEGSRTLFRAEKGVVGKLSDCGDGWCRLDVNGQRGYAPIASLWGATGD
ncbi:MAG: SH3 domain-containing protein [Sphingobium sp.]